MRLEDYMANRKGPQAGGLSTSSPFSITSSQTGLFGQQSTTTPQTGGIFGQQENKPLFGSTTPSLGTFIFFIIIYIIIYLLIAIKLILDI